MELVIKERVKNQLRNCYKIEVDFMFGDGDGNEVLTFRFSKEQYEDPYFKELTHDFIKSILSCIEYDSKGRGGFDTSSEVISYYAFGNDWREKRTPPYQWGRFCEDYTSGYEDDYEEELEYNWTTGPFSYWIPTYSEGWFGSYNYISIWYYDEEGYKHAVEIKND